MRHARIKADGAGYYHCISRIIERRMILGDKEKARLLKLMRDLAAFGGLHIFSYVFMSNHFHILLHVPVRQDVSDEELLRRLNYLYSPEEVKLIGRQLDDFRGHGHHQSAEQLKARYTYRMYNVSEFFKALKQRFSQYYNTREDRCGPLWEQRFKSILVEGSEDALLTMAAYVELNPVRARMVSDPRDYRDSSYGAAGGGDKQAREGLRRLMQAALDCGRLSWGKAQQLYRVRLYVQGAAKGLDLDGKPIRPGFTQDQVDRVIAQGGKLPMHVLLHCRVRYFTEGLALGSQPFVEKLFERYRSQFGRKRKTGARPMLFGDWSQTICTLRNLRTNPVSCS